MSDVPVDINGPHDDTKTLEGSPCYTHNNDDGHESSISTYALLTYTQLHSVRVGFIESDLK